MGRFWSAMTSVLRAMATARRWVWERCERTGALVARTIFAAVDVMLSGTGPGYMPIPEDPDAEPEQYLEENRQTQSMTIKKVAAQLLRDEPQEKDVSKLPKRVALWLACMETRELARLMASDHNQIEAHVYGEKCIPELLQFTQRHINERLAQKEDAEAQAAVEAAESKRRIEELDRTTRELEYSQRRRRAAIEDAEIVPSLTPGYGV